MKQNGIKTDMNNIQILRNKVEQLRGRRSEIEASIKSVGESIESDRKSLRWHERALEIIKAVGLKTQQELEYNISDIASLAMDTVFNDPYELKVKFVERRNKTECDITFNRDGKEFDPSSNLTGGGVVDIAAFALRCISWLIDTPRTRNVFILDEPFPRLRGDSNQRNTGEMLQEMHKQLKPNPQVIMVSDVAFSVDVDRNFEVVKVGKKSTVKER